MPRTWHSLRGKSAPLSNSNGQKPTHQPLVSLVPTPPASVDEYGEQVFREEAGRSCDDLRLTDSFFGPTGHHLAVASAPAAKALEGTPVPGELLLWHRHTAIAGSPPALSPAML
jgi:hypothetical protein